VDIGDGNVWWLSSEPTEFCECFVVLVRHLVLVCSGCIEACAEGGTVDVLLVGGLVDLVDVFVDVFVVLLAEVLVVADPSAE